MQILVLGDSDSSGALTGGVSWTRILEGRLRESGDADISIRSIGFSAVPPGASAYAERKVAELQPDAVIVLAGAWGFTYKLVALRVEQLFGKRVAAVYGRLETKFDSKTRQPDGKPGGVNGFARIAIRRIIGAKAQTSRAQLTANYQDVFRRLSRFEDTDVVVMTYPGIGEHAHTGNAPAMRRRFFADLEATAESLHLSWVSTEKLFAGFSDWHEYAIDELHFNELGHQMLADTIEPAVRACVPAGP